jgi:hypothetical protein
MKANITRGGGFRGALNYVFDVGPEATNEKNAELVGGNMSGTDPMSLSREFAVVRQLRPDIKKPVWHSSLALPKGERLSAEKWNEVSRDFLTLMGFDVEKFQYVAVRHNDTDYDHVHIIESRIALDGSVWLGQWEARRAIEATQELEKKHGLTITPGLGDARAERKKATRNEIKMAARKGDEPPRERLQKIVDQAAEGKPTALEFAQRLEAAGINVRANLATTGRMNGFSYELDGIYFKGQDLGEAYKWNGLQKRGVSYDIERDRAGLERFRAAVAVQQVQGGGDTPAFEKDPRRDLWRDYQASNRERFQRLAEQNAAQRQSEKARRAAIKDRFAERRAELEAQRGGKGTANAAQIREIRALLSVARMERATQEVALREEIDRERAELKAAKNRPYTYLDFLAERAQQTGDGLALAELRRMQAQRSRSLADEAVLRTQDMTQPERDAFHSEPALTYAVHVNGDVTYSRDDRQVIVDRGREVAMLQHDDKTVETAMRFAIAKWGSVLDMQGSPEQKRRAAELAAERYMRVKFIDPTMNAIMAERRGQMARERIEMFRKLGLTQPEKPQATPKERSMSTVEDEAQARERAEEEETRKRVEAGNNANQERYDAGLQANQDRADLGREIEAERAEQSRQDAIERERVKQDQIRADQQRTEQIRNDQARQQQIEKDAIQKQEAARQQGIQAQQQAETRARKQAEEEQANTQKADQGPSLGKAPDPWKKAGTLSHGDARVAEYHQDVEAGQSPYATHQQRDASLAGLRDKRGISESTIADAEKQGFFQVDSQGQRQFKGSEKEPGILRGDDNNVHIVKNDVEALALRDVAKREGLEPPTTLSMDQYKGNLQDSPQAKELLQKADNVTLQQGAADAQDVVNARGKNDVDVAEMPEGIESYEDLNNQQRQEFAEAEQYEQEQQEQQQEEQQRSHGMRR